MSRNHLGNQPDPRSQESMVLCNSELIIEVFRIPMRGLKLCCFVANGHTVKEQTFMEVKNVVSYQQQSYIRHW